VAKHIWRGLAGPTQRSAAERDRRLNKLAHDQRQKGDGSGYDNGGSMNVSRTEERNVSRRGSCPSPLSCAPR
jgi:hypothetical protein